MGRGQLRKLSHPKVNHLSVFVFSVLKINMLFHTYLVQCGSPVSREGGIQDNLVGFDLNTAKVNPIADGIDFENLFG